MKPGREEPLAILFTIVFSALQTIPESMPQENSAPNGVRKRLLCGCRMESRNEIR